MIERLKIAALDINALFGAPHRNADRIIGGIVRASGDGVSIAIFPELAISGIGGLPLHPSLLTACEAALKKIVKATKGRSVIAIVGTPALIDGKAYNAAAIICGGRILGLTLQSGRTGEYCDGADAPTDISIAGYRTTASVNQPYKHQNCSFRIFIGEHQPYEMLCPADIVVNISSAPAHISSLSGAAFTGKALSGQIYVYACDSAACNRFLGSGAKLVCAYGSLIAAVACETDYTAVDADIRLARGKEHAESGCGPAVSIDSFGTKKAGAPFTAQPFALSGRMPYAAIDILSRALSLTLQGKDVFIDGGGAHSALLTAICMRLCARYGFPPQNFHVYNDGGGRLASISGFFKEDSPPSGGAILSPLCFTDIASGASPAQETFCPLALVPATAAFSMAAVFCKDRLPPQILPDETAIKDFLIHALFIDKLSSRSAFQRAESVFVISRKNLQKIKKSLLQSLLCSRPDILGAIRILPEDLQPLLDLAPASPECF